MNACDHRAIVDGGGNCIPDFRNRETHVICGLCGEGFDYRAHEADKALAQWQTYCARLAQHNAEFGTQHAPEAFTP